MLHSSAMLTLRAPTRLVSTLSHPHVRKTDSLPENAIAIATTPVSSAGGDIAQHADERGLQVSCPQHTYEGANVCLAWSCDVETCIEPGSFVGAALPVV